MSKELEYTFLKRKQTNANTYTERYSTSLIIREMQIKPIVKYYLTSARIAITKNKDGC